MRAARLIPIRSGIKDASRRGFAAVYGRAVRPHWDGSQTLRDWVHRFNAGTGWPHQPQGRGPDAYRAMSR